MFELDPMNIALRWIGLTAIFLFLTYLFRDRVTLEGFWGYFLLLFMMIPLNVLGGRVGYAMGLPLNRPWIFGTVIVPLDVVILFIWSRYMPGMTSTSRSSLLLFAILFSAFAIGLHLVPAFPFATFFPRLSGH